MRRTHPLIAGGGPAGSATAIALARGGAKPTIIERERATGDALCGGFLSWHTLAALDRLGVTGEVLDGHPIGTLRLFAGQARAEARLPAGAIGVSRHRLDSVMLDSAQAEGAGLERGVTVREIDDTIVRLADGGELNPDALFLAIGKHDVRGATRARTGNDPTLGLRVKLGPHPALDRLVGSAIELHLFDRAYAGLLIQEDGRANLCLAVRKSRLGEAGGRPEALLAALGHGTPLGERLAFMEGAPLIDAIASVPYGWRAPDTVAGRFRLGDQAAVIPSLAGEGIGIAVASGIAAAQAYLHGGPFAAQGFQHDFFARTRRPVGVAKLLWQLCERPLPAQAATRVVAALPQIATLMARATRIGD